MKKYSALLMGAALFAASLNLRPAINSVPPILDAICKELGISALVASLLTSIPVLCMGILPPLAVKLGQRFGIERIITWALAIIGAGTVLRFWANSAFILLITACIAGVGIAAASPLLSGFIKKHFHAKVPLMISLYTVAMAVGATIASGLSLPLQNALHTWKSSLGIWAILAAAALLIWGSLLFQIERPNGRAQASERIKLPWSDRKAWLFTLSFGLMAVLFYSITAWLPQIIQGLGYSKEYAGRIFTVFSVTQIPLGLLLPVLLGRIPSRLFWLLTGSAVMLTGFLMLLFSIQPWLAAILIGFGPGILFPLNLLLPIEAAGDANQAAAWSAMTQSVGYVLGALGPILFGWIHDLTGSYSLIVTGLIIVVLVMVLVQLGAVQRREPIYQSAG
ncbi:CynX/NimT family MFS transporter [Paenibacillus caui]|uniref:MFS transporter n=1 Tax=Paenibacillus caui TaxID=2873927 RepID=UPI001CA8CB68|nr:MFS transporter [Paenibacillus caui]